MAAEAGVALVAVVGAVASVADRPRRIDLDRARAQLVARQHGTGTL